MYSSALSLTSGLDGLGGHHHAPAALTPRKRLGTHYIGGWLGPRAGLAPTGIRSPNRPARSKSLYQLSYPRC
jgi:hypothetical protein